MGKYTIKDMEVVSGVKAHTIRIWEKRYSLLIPKRNENNQRLYSDKQLRYLLNISSLIKCGFRISKLAQLSNSELEKLSRQRHSSARSSEQFGDEITALLFTYNEIEVRNAIDKLVAHMGFEAAFEQHIFPFLEKLGVLWQTGSLRVSHEHFLSNIIRNQIIVETEKFAPVSSTAGNAVAFFTHEKELHDIGLLYYHYIARKNNIRTYFLGKMVSVSILKQFVAETKVNLLFTQFVNGITKARLEQYIEKLTLQIPSCRFLFTGEQMKIHKPKLPLSGTMVKNKEQFVFQAISS